MIRTRRNKARYPLSFLDGFDRADKRVLEMGTTWETFTPFGVFVSLPVVCVLFAVLTTAVVAFKILDLAQVPPETFRGLHRYLFGSF